MINQLTINFGNIINELQEENLNLCFVRDRGIFIEDENKNLYIMENYYYGSYLDKLIKNNTSVKFDLVDESKSKNVGDWEKKIWSISEVKDFIKRQKLI